MVNKKIQLVIEVKKLLEERTLMKGNVTIARGEKIQFLVFETEERCYYLADIMALDDDTDVKIAAIEIVQNFENNIQLCMGVENNIKCLDTINVFNYEMFKAFLSTVPHLRIMDFALCYYQEEPVGSIKRIKEKQGLYIPSNKQVFNEAIEHIFQKTRIAIFDAKNTPNNYEPVYYLTENIKEIKIEKGIEILAVKVEEGYNIGLFLLNDMLMEWLANYFQEDIVLFSPSNTTLLVIGRDNQDYMRLKKDIKENARYLRKEFPQLYLSGNCYEYNRFSKKITISN